jgi:hypothetical protein
VLSSLLSCTFGSDPGRQGGKDDAKYQMNKFSDMFPWPFYFRR